MILRFCSTGSDDALHFAMTHVGSVYEIAPTWLQFEGALDGDTHTIFLENIKQKEKLARAIGSEDEEEENECMQTHCTIRSIIQGIIAHIPLNASHEEAQDQNCNETLHPHREFK